MTSRKNRPLRLIALGLAGAAVVAASATAAQADTLRHRDATGDVVVTAASSSGATSTRVDSAQRNPDFTSLTVGYDADRLSISAGMRDFGGIDDSWSAVVITSKGDRFDFRRSTSTGSETGLPEVSVKRNGYRLSCEGIVVSRTSAGVIVRAPSSCLGDPYRVRVGAKAEVFYREDGPGDQTGADDAFRVKGGDDSRPVTLGSWVVR